MGRGRRGRAGRSARPAARAQAPEDAASGGVALVGRGYGSGATAAALPFYPAGWTLGLAALVATTTLVRARAGVVLALAVPVLPLGNTSAGLAWAYGIFALLWLAFTWRDARKGLFFIVGAVLAPLSALGLLPLAAVHALRGRARRAVHTVAAVVFAAVVAGVRGIALPFTGSIARPLQLDGERSPSAVSATLWHAFTAHPALVVETIVLAAAAAALPVRRAAIAPFGVLLLAGLVAPNPAISDAAVVATVVATCLGLAAWAES